MAAERDIIVVGGGHNPRYSKLWDTFFEVMDPLLLREPPTLGEVAAHFEGVKGGEEALRAILTMSARDVLEDYFESEYVKVGLCGNAVIGTMVGPSTPGSVYVLGHHLLGDPRSWPLPLWLGGPPGGRRPGRPWTQCGHGRA